MEGQNCRVGKTHKGVKLTRECFAFPPIRRKPSINCEFEAEVAWNETCPHCLKPWWEHDKKQKIGREYLEKLSRIWIKAFDLQYPICAIKNYQE